MRFALFTRVRTQGSMLGGGARVQNLGHIEMKMCYFHSVFCPLGSDLNKYLQQYILIWIIDTL